MKLGNVPTDLKNDLEAGFAVVFEVLDESQIAALIEATQTSTTGAVSQRESIFAIRNLLEMPAIRELARSPEVRALVEPVLGPDAFAVRGIFFDKTPDANWKVVWHQDLSIAVQEKREVEGYGPWSVKAGTVHVQPPMEVLERMITVRLHLDHCTLENGPLKVIAGSHRLGRLSAEQIAEQRAQNEEITVPVPLGGALLMRPLILHASSPSQTPAHWRVVHLEFAAQSLPDGLEWHQRV
jgi:ectoine hydroxylase-related dioxygenase (phytanoyl-CoA dioxygenase family)